MIFNFRRGFTVLAGAWMWLYSQAAAPSTFTVCTYNVENYLIVPSGTRTAKTEASRDQVVKELLAIRPDVLALQEIGGHGALNDLQQRLRAGGWELPHAELATGWDTNIFVAVLSRYPFTARRSHTNDTFLLGGRRLHSSRGVAEVEVQVTPRTRFTLLAAHLKSKRQSGRVDESELREAEARQVREHLEAALKRSPEVPVVVCGDFNDHRDSRTLRLLVSRGKAVLEDTRPEERLGSAPNRRRDGGNRRVVWTHFYSTEDSYSRFDYILLSRSMVPRWRRSGSYVHASPDWGLASDHRPVVCEFSVAE